MKITKSQLQRIIKEELKQVLQEISPEFTDVPPREAAQGQNPKRPYTQEELEMLNATEEERSRRSTIFAPIPDPRPTTFRRELPADVPVDLEAYEAEREERRREAESGLYAPAVDPDPRYGETLGVDRYGAPHPADEPMTSALDPRTEEENRRRNLADDIKFVARNLDARPDVQGYGFDDLRRELEDQGVHFGPAPSAPGSMAQAPPHIRKQLSMREGLINDITEAVLAKLVK